LKLQKRDTGAGPGYGLQRKRRGDKRDEGEEWRREENGGNTRKGLTWWGTGTKYESHLGRGDAGAMKEKGCWYKKKTRKNCGGGVKER